MTDLDKLVDKRILEEVGYFFNKVNERAEYLRGYRDSYSSDGHPALDVSIEYFPFHYPYDDFYINIISNILSSDLSIENKICNTVLSHFYGGRGIHQILTREPDPKKALVDFERLLVDPEYEQKIRENIKIAEKYNLPFYGSTELRTSLFGASNKWVSESRKISKNADKINILLWVAGFIPRGIVKKIKESSSLKEIYETLTTIEGVGSYYGYVGSIAQSINPDINANHDERFCMPGPGSRRTCDMLFGIDCKVPYGDRIIWFRENYRNYIGEIKINENEWNRTINGRKVFKDDQNELKTAGCETGLCQFGIYKKLSENPHLIKFRKVARIEESVINCFFNDNSKTISLF